MSIKYEEANILIVSDSAAEITDLKNLLATLVGRLTFALSKDEGIQTFKAQHPIMLVLAFTDVANSVQFYQQLNQEIPEITEHFHHTLLLCSSKEAYDAYHLCEEGVFDDYLVDHPLYDPQRIILSIEQALQNQLMERKVLALHQQNRHSRKLPLTSSPHRSSRSEFSWLMMMTFTENRLPPFSPLSGTRLLKPIMASLHSNS